MTKLSKKPINQEKLGHYVNNLWSAFTLMDSKEAVRALFRDLFTHTEYKMFAKRFEIARRLLNGDSYDSIRNSLNVTNGTISHVSNILINRGEGFRDAHKRLNEIEQKFLQKQSERQKFLERRKRRKLPMETFLPELLKVGMSAADKAISRKLKYSSVKKKLSIN